MKKLIWAIIICVMIVSLMIAQTLTAFAESSIEAISEVSTKAGEKLYEIRVTADKTEVTPGDEITFTINLGPVDKFGTMEMKLDIPDGLTFVTGSFAKTTGLEATLGFDQIEFTESSKLFNGFASMKDYSSTEDTVLATFMCKANDDFTGTVSVNLKNCEFLSCMTWEDLTDQFEIIPAIVKSPEEDIPQQGWKKEGSYWYYILSDGTKAVGWKKVGTKWYYMDKDGIMQTGWTKVGTKWYYMNKSGAMLTGWQKISNKWYYLNTSGVMMTGWQKIGSKDYFFKSSGVMASNEWVKGYWWLNKDGTWTYKYKASWTKTSDGHWMFRASNGWIAKSTTIIISDVSYTFNAKGYMI